MANTFSHSLLDSELKHKDRFYNAKVVSKRYIDRRVVRGGWIGSLGLNKGSAVWTTVWTNLVKITLGIGTTSRFFAD